MLLMALFHFCYDLKRFHVFEADFNESLFWIAFRGLVMGSFMLLVGISFWLAQPRYADRRYWIRFARVAGCAALTSIATYFAVPKYWIFFGVLHLVAAATLLAPLLIRIPILLLPISILFMALAEFYTAPWFHQPGWNILGLSPWLPKTEDFAAVFPWLGVIFFGVFVGWTTAKWPTRVTALEIPGLSRLGRHALIFYMTHQLVLFPLAWLISKLWG